jgi:glycogen debranching enzyme
MPISPADRSAIHEGAAALLAANRKKGRDSAFKRDYSYVCPSRFEYQWQWFWDSCFHAVALTHVDHAAAKQELRTLWSIQQSDGFIPHMVFWGTRFLSSPTGYLQSKPSWRPKMTALIQPPVLALAALRVADATQDKDFLREAIDHCKRYYLWLRDRRDPDADSLISVISPYETGMDHLPAYDEALGAKSPSRWGLQVRDRLLDIGNLTLGRGYNLPVVFKRDKFNVEDVLMNCLYAQGLRAIAAMCVKAGQEGEAAPFAKMAGRTEQAVLSKCYDPRADAFWSLAGKKEQPLRTLTIASLMPLLLDGLPKDIASRLVERHLLSPSEFWLPYPVPTISKSERAFKADETFLIWRGPSWINTNWLLFQGLRKHGFHEPARHIAERSAELVLKSGFREYYNPLTGQGYGAKDFGWSTLIVDML